MRTVVGLTVDTMAADKKVEQQASKPAPPHMAGTHGLQVWGGTGESLRCNVHLQAVQEASLLVA